MSDKREFKNGDLIDYVFERSFGIDKLKNPTYQQFRRESYKRFKSYMNSTQIVKELFY